MPSTTLGISVSRRAMLWSHVARHASHHLVPRDHVSQIILSKPFRGSHETQSMPRNLPTVVLLFWDY